MEEQTTFVMVGKGLKESEMVLFQAQPVSPDLISKMFGNRVACSPIVTVEPRRRKFHKPITLTIPVPKAAQKGMINQYPNENPSLRLLCSITGELCSCNNLIALSIAKTHRSFGYTECNRVGFNSFET